MEIFLVIIAIGLVCMFLSYAIAKTPLSAVIGFLLGPLGVLIACFLPKGPVSAPAPAEPAPPPEAPVKREPAQPLGPQDSSKWTGRQ